MEMDKPTLLQWVFDTRSWFPEATQTRQLETHVWPHTLSLRFKHPS